MRLEGGNGGAPVQQLLLSSKKIPGVCGAEVVHNAAG